ncbi:aminoacyl-tRNA hydrolase [Alsobacter sp. SYSU M60028]|uniref:Aminoacyl-tRNA hydrolase n=1 Tax=Alsobacter ponti TaxID=2962936 RepID=A0ABT1LGZ8_9HYPH|nr:alternative ribosome rescue aminoacyl-tRNA hydrolase ArfB [Alsobacter ponti]MCP8940236.1 aminoacyl-tRNA hydrolase [Alsobacter ponti]
MIRVTGRISLDERELDESFLRASGPGGQNVNKVETAVQLRLDVARSPSLPDEVKERLKALAGSRMTQDGVLVITAQRHRTQERNRQDALERLLDLIRQAAVRPLVRRPTRPTLASKKRRLDSKSRRATVKKLRGEKPPGD